MAKAIWRYEIPLDPKTAIKMPKGAKILFIDTQDHPLRHPVPSVWAFIDTDEQEMESWVIRIYGTGHVIEDDISDHYKGSFLTMDGAFVWHVFMWTLCVDDD